MIIIIPMYKPIKKVTKKEEDQNERLNKLGSKST